MQGGSRLRSRPGRAGYPVVREPRVRQDGRHGRSAARRRRQPSRPGPWRRVRGAVVLPGQQCGGRDDPRPPGPGRRALALDRRHRHGAGDRGRAHGAGPRRPRPAGGQVRGGLPGRPLPRVRVRDAHAASPARGPAGPLGQVRQGALRRPGQPRQRRGDAGRAARRVVQRRPEPGGGAGQAVGRGHPCAPGRDRRRGRRRRGGRLGRGQPGRRRTGPGGLPADVRRLDAGRAGPRRHPGRRGAQAGRARVEGGRRPRQRAAHQRGGHRPVRAVERGASPRRPAWRPVGDVDTTCAITGGVVAARTGLAAVPARWLELAEPLPGWAAAG
jgi:hypothetical protein